MSVSPIVAARVRRQKESELIQELISLLPIAALTDQSEGLLDHNASHTSSKTYAKQSIVSSPSKTITNKIGKMKGCMLAITFFKLRQVLENVHQSNLECGNHFNWLNKLFKNPLHQFLLDSLGSFFMFISPSSDIYFTSDNVYRHLHLQQMEILGHNLSDITYPDDLPTLEGQFHLPREELLSHISRNGGDTGYLMIPRKFTLRLRVSHPHSSFTLHPHPLAARLLTLYKTFSLSAKLLVSQTSRQQSPTPSGYNILGMVAVVEEVAESVNPGYDRTLVVPYMFSAIHKMDCTYIKLDHKVPTLLGYPLNEMLGRTAFSFHHPEDGEIPADCHRQLISKGESLTLLYRFLSATNVYLWMRTRAYVRGNYIYTDNFILSEEQAQRVLIQQEPMRREKNVSSFISEKPCKTVVMPSMLLPSDTTHLIATTSSSPLSSSHQSSAVSSPTVLQWQADESAPPAEDNDYLSCALDVLYKHAFPSHSHSNNTENEKVTLGKRRRDYVVANTVTYCAPTFNVESCSSSPSYILPSSSSSLSSPPSSSSSSPSSSSSLPSSSDEGECSGEVPVVQNNVMVIADDGEKCVRNGMADLLALSKCWISLESKCRNEQLNPQTSLLADILTGKCTY